MEIEQSNYDSPHYRHNECNSQRKLKRRTNLTKFTLNSIQIVLVRNLKPQEQHNQQIILKTDKLNSKKLSRSR